MVETIDLDTPPINSPTRHLHASKEHLLPDIGQTDSPSWQPPYKRCNVYPILCQTESPSPLKKRRLNSEKSKISPAQKTLEQEQREVRQANFKTDRKDAMRELLLIIPPSLYHPDHPLSPLLPEIQAALPSPTNFRQSTVERRNLSGCLYFLRNVSRHWDSSRRCFVPLTHPESREENLFVHFLHIDAVVDKVKVDALRPEMESLINAVEGIELYLVVIDYLEWQKRTKLQSRRNESIPRETEKQLMMLQIMGIHVICPESRYEIIRWVIELARDLAHRPYRAADKNWSNLFQGFADESKRAEKEQTLIYKAILQSIGKGVTDSVASAIVDSRYSTLSLLMQGYDRCSNETQQEQMLANILVEHNRNGSYKGRVIGPTISKRIKQVFCESDGQTLVERRLFDRK